MAGFTESWNGLTVKVSVRFFVPPALLEEIVMLLLVAVVGFPEISTVEATKLSRSPPFPRRVKSPWNQAVELSWTTFWKAIGGNGNPDGVRQIRSHLQFKSVDRPRRGLNGGP